MGYTASEAWGKAWDEELRADVGQAICQAMESRADGNFLPGRVRCLGVSWAVESKGAQYWIVDISGGHDEVFCETVRRTLESMGWGIVEVRFDW